MGPAGLNSVAPPALDSSELVPSLHDTLTQDFDVESVLNNVKTESVDSPMVWI